MMTSPRCKKGLDYTGGNSALKSVRVARKKRAAEIHHIIHAGMCSTLKNAVSGYPGADGLSCVTQEGDMPIHL